MGKSMKNLTINGQTYAVEDARLPSSGTPGQLLRVKTVDSEGKVTEVDTADAADGSGITAITGNADGSWTLTYSDGTTQTVSSEGYQAITAQMSKLSAQIAEKEQLAPTFANSIDECTDTSKLYVLPDGYIYAYMTKSVEPAQVELADRSEYLLNTRFNTSGAETADSGWYITNYLRVDMTLANPPVMCFNGVPPVYTDQERSINERVIFYDKDKNPLGAPIYTGLNMYYETLGGSQTLINGAAGLNVPGEYTWNVGYIYTAADVYEKLSYYDQIAYVRFSCNYASGHNGPSPLTNVDEIAACSITLAAQGSGEAAAGWASTGHAFVPTDYEDRIVELEALSVEQQTRIATLEDKAGDEEAAVPAYWREALESGAEAINTAMTAAGYNKAAFLFYSDAHWDYGSQMAPVLLKWLYRHTGMTKTIFGGDIVNGEAADYAAMSYLWDWRCRLKELPNHHSVVGNHDDGNATNDLFSERYVYGYLLAAEETADIVRPDSGLWYSIDNPAEKTRYLYLDTAYQGLSVLPDAETAFINAALLGTPAGWHIVVAAHIWYLPDYDQSDVRPIPVTGMSGSAAQLSTILDNYNARAGAFADCGGKVEFCVGGHLHRDYDGTTPGGIPIVLVETDSYHIRSSLPVIAGTTTEASVNGIICDYDQSKITVVRVGRGESREIYY